MYLHLLDPAPLINFSTLFRILVNTADMVVLLESLRAGIVGSSLYLSAVNHNLEISNQVCKIFIVSYFNDNLKIYLL